MDHEFEQFMTALGQKYARTQSDAAAAQDLQGSNSTADEDFLHQLAELAPQIVDRWTQYLAAGGDLTMDQAFFGEGNYALRRAQGNRKADRDYAFLHWLHLEQAAYSGGGRPPNLAELARLFDADNWQSVVQDYLSYRSAISGLPPLKQQHCGSSNSAVQTPTSPDAPP